MQPPSTPPNLDAEAVILALVEKATNGRYPVIKLLDFGPTSDGGTSGRFQSTDQQEYGFLIGKDGTKVFALKQGET